MSISFAAECFNGDVSEKIEKDPNSVALKAHLSQNSKEAIHPQTPLEVEKERLDVVYDWLEEEQLKTHQLHVELMETSERESTRYPFEPNEFREVPEVNCAVGLGGQEDPSRRTRMAHPVGRIAQTFLHALGRHYTDSGLLQFGFLNSLPVASFGVSVLFHCCDVFAREADHDALGRSFPILS